MTSTEAVHDLEEARVYGNFLHKRVRLVYNSQVDPLDPSPDAVKEAVEIIGKIEAVADPMKTLMIRGRGRSVGFLVDYSDIIEMNEEVEPIKPLKQKELKLPDGAVRQHLADRHGYLLVYLNSINEDQAADEHDKIDHAPLGHFHSDGDESEGSSDEDSAETGGDTD